MEQLSLKDPQTKILIITLCIILAAFSLNKKFILSPHRDKIARLKARLEHIKFEDEIAKITAEVANYEKSLSPQKDPSWLLTQLTESAAQTKLNIESIEPLPLKQIPPYSYVSFMIKTTCTFNTLLNFIESVESCPYILNIENLKLESKGTYKPEVPKGELDKETEAGVQIVIGTIY